MSHNFPGEEITTKFNYLRIVYRANTKRIREAARKGVTFIPTYRYFKYLKFLDEFEVVGGDGKDDGEGTVEGQSRGERNDVLDLDEGSNEAEPRSEQISEQTGVILVSEQKKNYFDAEETVSEKNNNYVDAENTVSEEINNSTVNDCGEYSGVVAAKTANVVDGLDAVDFLMDLNFDGNENVHDSDDEYASEYDIDAQTVRVLQSINNFNPSSSCSPPPPPIQIKNKINKNKIDRSRKENEKDDQKKKKLKRKDTNQFNKENHFEEKQETSTTKTWSTEEESELINFYAAHECLWKCKHPDYYKKNRSSLLDIIVERLEMKFTGIFFFPLWTWTLDIV